MWIPPKFKFHQESPSVYERFKQGLVLFGLTTLSFCAIILLKDKISIQSLYFVSIPIIVFLIGFLIANLERIYDGWTLEEYRIYLTTHKFLIKSKRVKILFSEIQNVEYYPPGRFGHLLAFKTRNQGNLLLSPLESEYTSAYILKYLRERKITIRFRRSDKEIELYVRGKIEKLPVSLDDKFLDKSS